MNKKYIDFVPTNKDGRGKTPVNQGKDVAPTVRRRAVAPTVRRGTIASVPARRVTMQSTSTKRVSTGGISVKTVSARRVTTKRGTGMGRSTRQAEVYTELPAMQNDLMAIDTEMDSFSLNGGTSEFGVVEDLPSRFVNTAVDKRPLSNGPVAQSNIEYAGYAGYDDYGGGFETVNNDAVETAKEVKAKKIGKKPGKASKKLPKKGANMGAGVGTGAVGTGLAMSQTNVKTNNTYNVPKSPFINQGSVAKRPLSKNVYQKKVQPTKEGNQGPVAIISKPEKDSKAGVVVGIILTIILGAAAGTIAFLLLPK